MSDRFTATVTVKISRPPDASVSSRMTIEEAARVADDAAKDARTDQLDVADAFVSTIERVEGSDDE